MNSKNFTEGDKEKLIELLNMVAKHATFNMDTKQIINFYKLLNYAQAQLIPKIEEHILEIRKVHQPNEQDKSTETEG